MNLLCQSLFLAVIAVQLSLAQHGQDLLLTVCNDNQPSDRPNCGGNCQQYELHDRTCYLDSQSHSWLFSCMPFDKCFSYMLLEGGCGGSPIERGRQACSFCSARSTVQCNFSSITQKVQCNDDCQTCTDLYTAQLGTCTEIKEFDRKNGLHVDANYNPCELVLVQQSNTTDCSVLSSSTIEADGNCFPAPNNPFMTFQIDCKGHHHISQANLPEAPQQLVEQLTAALSAHRKRFV